MPSGAVPEGRGSPLQPKGVGLPGITRKRVGFPLKILDKRSPPPPPTIPRIASGSQTMPARRFDESNTPLIFNTFQNISSPAAPHPTPWPFPRLSSRPTTGFVRASLGRSWQGLKNSSPHSESRALDDSKQPISSEGPRQQAPPTDACPREPKRSRVEAHPDY